MRRNRKRGLSTSPSARSLVIVVVATYLGFTKEIPFRDHYTVSAVFKTANNVAPELARAHRRRQRRQGHDGRAASATASQAAVVRCASTSEGLPLHKDATLTIRPRIFLEGNFFVDLQPGLAVSAPSSTTATRSRSTRRAAPVQLDQVLTALQARHAQGPAGRCSTSCRPGLDGEGGGASTARSRYWEPAYRDSARSSTTRTLGHEPSTTSRATSSGAGDGRRGAGPQPGRSCKSLHHRLQHDRRRVRRARTARCRARSPSCRGRCAPASPRWRRSTPRSRRCARFVADLRPGVRSSGPALDAALPFVAQLRGLVSPAELRGLVARPAPDGPGAGPAQQRDACRSTSRSALASSCQNEVDPALDARTRSRTRPSRPTGPVFEEATKPLAGPRRREPRG